MFHNIILGLFMLGAFTLGIITGGTLGYSEAKRLYEIKVGRHFDGVKNGFTNSH